VISVVCLPKMRRSDASELFLTAERFTPQRAVDAGLINAAVPADRLDDAVEDYVDKIVRGGPLALAACKELIATVPGMELGEAFEWTAPMSARLFQSDEATAGIAAFNARGSAPWIPDERTSRSER
jgi:methylglutaconyl-CoA hydratase